MAIKRWNSKWLELNLTITLFLKFITCSSLVSFGYILLMGILYINQYFQIRHIHTFLRKYYFQTQGKILCSKVFPKISVALIKDFVFSLQIIHYIYLWSTLAEALLSMREVCLTGWHIWHEPRTSHWYIWGIVIQAKRWTYHYLKQFQTSSFEYLRDTLIKKK